MSEQKCPYHYDHENRIERLEGDMKEVLSALSNQKIWVAIIGLIATTVSAAGAALGVIIAAYLKVGGI
jgi:DNA-binding FrmR family transcriptional regulator